MVSAQTNTAGGCQVCHLGPMFSLLQLCIFGFFIHRRRCCPLHCCESRVFESKGQLTSVRRWTSRVPRSVLRAGSRVRLFCSGASAVLSRCGGHPSLTDLPVHCPCSGCKSGLCAPRALDVLPPDPTAGRTHRRVYIHMCTGTDSLWLLPAALQSGFETYFLCQNFVAKS